MQGALIGGSLGVIGALVGAVLALWWRSKCFQAEGRAQTLASRLATEEEQHDETIKQAVIQAERFEGALKTKETVIRELEFRNQSLLRRSVENADLHDLLDLANRPTGLRLVHTNKDGDGN